MFWDWSTARAITLKDDTDKSNEIFMIRPESESAIPV